MNQVDPIRPLQVSEPVSILQALVIEDEAFLAIMYADVLEAMGHHVYAIEVTVTGAVAAAARHRPGLMIVDNNLRDGSGVSAVNEILGTGFVPHVFVTGDSFVDQGSGQDAIVLQKPFSEADLIRAIEVTLVKSNT